MRSLASLLGNTTTGSRLVDPFTGAPVSEGATGPNVYPSGINLAGALSGESLVGDSKTSTWEDDSGTHFVKTTDDGQGNVTKSTGTIGNNGSWESTEDQRSADGSRHATQMGSTNEDGGGWYATDTYYDEDGNATTHTYYVRRDDGSAYFQRWDAATNRTVYEERGPRDPETGEQQVVGGGWRNGGGPHETPNPDHPGDSTFVWNPAFAPTPSFQLSSSKAEELHIGSDDLGDAGEVPPIVSQFDLLSQTDPDQWQSPTEGMQPTGGVDSPNQVLPPDPNQF